MNKTFNLMLGLWCLSLLLVATSFAGVNTWTSSGPETGNIASLAINPSDPSRIYAGTYYSGGKIFRSTDSGNSWQASTVPSADSVSSIVVDRGQEATLYAAGDATVYKSTDDGISWNALGALPTNQIITSLLVANNTPMVMFASTYNGVFTSTSGGTTWSAINNGLPLNPMFSGNPTITSSDGLFVVASGKIYRRLSGETSWVEVVSGIAATESIGTIAIDPSQETTLYAVSSSNLLYKTINSGNSWVAVTPQRPMNNVGWLSVSPISSDVIFCFSGGGGVSRSNDRGLTWSPASKTGLPYADYFVYEINPINPQIQFAGGNGDLYKSIDGGMSWSKAMNGLSAASIYAFGLVKGITNDIIVGTGSGDALYRSSDGGLSWVSSSSGLPTFISVSDIVVHPVNPQIVYAVYNSETGVSRSSDGGLSWNPVTYNDATSKNSVKSLLIAPSDPSTIYICVTVYNTYPNTGYIYKSTNGGNSWIAAVNSGLLTNDYISSLVVDSNDSKILYARTYGNIYKSTDGGDSWTILANTGLPANVRISSVAVEPATGDVFLSVYSYTKINNKSVYTSGAYRLVNGTWTLLANSIAGYNTVSNIFFDKTAVGHYYLGLGIDIYRSKDSGATWEKMIYPGLMGLIKHLAIHPGNTSSIYALTSVSGLYSLVEVATPPAVTSHAPQSNATGVSIQSPVTITFDKTLLAASVTGTSVSVTKLSASNITGSVSATGNTISFTPSSPLEYGTSYVVYVAPGIKDLDGTPTTLSTSWQFTTESAPKKILTVGFSGSGIGSVISNPDQLSCQVAGNCSGLYNLNSSVSLTATPGNSSYFVEWQGACQGINLNYCTIASMYGDMSVIAKFDLMPIFNSTLPGYFMDFTTAFQGSGMFDTIYYLQATILSTPLGSLIIDQQKTITLHGGYDSSFSTRNGSTSIVVGSAESVVIKKGTVVFDQVVIR